MLLSLFSKARKKEVPFSDSNPLRNEIYVRVREYTDKEMETLNKKELEDVEKLYLVQDKAVIKLTSKVPNACRVFKGRIMIRGLGLFDPKYFLLVKNYKEKETLHSE